MGAEFARLDTIHSCDPEEIDFYESNPCRSSEAERLSCSACSIIYCPTVVAGFIGLLVKQHAIGRPAPHELLFGLASSFLSH